MLGSDKDPTWWDFPQALAETRGVRQYITLFEAPFEASVLSDRENNALQAGSLLAVPPPAPGTQPLAGSHRLICRGPVWPSGPLTCRMSPPAWECQTPSQTSALWTPLMMSYTAMASSTETTASSSAAGVPPPRYPPPGLPPLKPAPLDMLLAPTSENLLATAGVGRSGRGQRQPSTPTAPGLRQTRPTPPQQRTPTPGRQETSQVTPYRQQVYPPQRTSGVWMTTPKPSTAPSTSQGHEETARGSRDARGRSSSRGPQGWHRRDRSSTRGSRKHWWGLHSDNPMDNMSNYMASGWKRDLTHIISCCWAAQVGPLDSEEWEVAIHKFLKAMRNRRAVE